MKHKGLIYVLAAFMVGLSAIQFIQPERANPPIDPQMAFETALKPSPEASGILRRSCYNCHSHSTQWPWYSRVAPVSWLIADDVKDGRRHLNFSTWGQLSNERAREALKGVCSEVRDGEMPLWIYTLMHPRARLSEADKAVLCRLIPNATEPK